MAFILNILTCKGAMPKYKRKLDRYNESAFVRLPYKYLPTAYEYCETPCGFEPLLNHG